MSWDWRCGGWRRSWKAARVRMSSRPRSNRTRPEADTFEAVKSWTLAATVVALATVISLLLRPHLAPVNLAMVYLIGVVGVSARSHRNIAVATALASVAAFDFFCVRPYYTFVVED